MKPISKLIYLIAAVLCALLLPLGAIADVTLPSDLTAIEAEAFLNDTTLTGTLTLPDGVTSIGDAAFSGCTGLTAVALPDSVTTIGSKAFSGCTGLTGTLVLGADVTVADDAFEGCTGLTVTIRQTATDASCFAYTIADGEVTITGFADGVSLTEIVIPDEIEGKPVTSIGGDAFGWQSDLRSVTLPDTLVSIGNQAFCGCSFSSITLPEGLKTIGSGAFFANEALSSINIPDSVTSISSGVFEHDGALATLNISANHPVFGFVDGMLYNKNTKTLLFCLYGSSGLGTSRTVPDGIETIGECAFRYCSWLTEINLPSTLKRIEQIAFGFDDGTCEVTSLTIPDSVEYIGYWAFANWKNLTELNISSDIAYVDDRAFAYCSALTGTLTFSSSALIHAEAFTGCDNLTISVETAEGASPASHFNYAIANGEVTITSYKNPLGYTSITVPAQIEGLPVTKIGTEAFSGCSALTEIVLPEGVTSIGSYAFSSCSALTSVTLPTTVTTVGQAIFNYCNAVTAVNLAADHPVLGFSDGMLYSKADMRLISAIIPQSTTTLTIPGSIRIIGSRSISASGLKSLTLAEGVTAIESYGIQSAYNLTSLTVPTTLMTLESNAIAGTYNLRTTITLSNGATVADGAIPDGNVTIVIADPESNDTPAEYFGFIANDTGLTITSYTGPDAITEVCIPAKINGTPVTELNPCLFFNNSVIKSLTIPEGVTTIGEECFRQMSALESISLPSTLTSIGDSCFVWCDQLKSISIPDSVTSFGSSLFAECSSMTVCKLPSGLKTLPSRTFGNCTGLTTLTLPSTLTTISAYAFEGAAIDALVLPDSVTTLEANALYWFSVKNLTLSANLTTIPAQAMRNCYSLTSLVIPEGVTSIGDQAFMSCSALTSLSLPSTLTSIGTGVFTDCYNLTSVTIAPENDAFAVSNGALVNIKTGELMLLLTGLAEDGSYTVGSGVTKIGANAFSYSSDLTSIVIPEGVTTIGDSAFLWCENLTSVSLPASVTSIAENAFGYCPLLETITIAEGNTHYSVTDNMLVSADMTLLVPMGGLTATSYTVPEGIVRIGDYAFYHARQLTSITLPSTLRSIGSYAFGYTFALQSITLPEGLTSIDSRAFTDTGLTSLTMPNTVTSLGSYAFYSSDLTSITLSSNLTAIPERAFWSTPLEAITLPDSVQSTGTYSFGYCQQLTSVTIGSGLTTIDFGSFAYCSSLCEIYIPATVTTIGEWILGASSDDLVVTVEPGSAAEAYCNLDGIPYVYLSEQNGYS